MLSALLRPFKGSSHAKDDADIEHNITFRPSVAEYRSHLHATADFTEADDDDEEESNDGHQPRYPLGDRGDEDEDGLARSTGLLPVFSVHHLDSLPIYSMTHAIRILVQTRTETTLTWEQLRSPQVSQFLVKPMQQLIRNQHFSPATLYALMANCLQFEKEGQLYPGNAGTSATRARVCELLAIKLLKEYATRELIDALCYDFYPLQGVPGSHTPHTPGGGKQQSAALRTSTLEIAIRASAKNFLSHPLVVQQLEAIWNGAINFASRTETFQPQASTSSAAGSSQSRRQSTIRTPLLGEQRSKAEPARPTTSHGGRRFVTLYNPRTASPFKLSRLRVPRYRRILSTCSLLGLICLFLVVLGQRSSRITTPELIFWFWSAGFMLDELVGFNEQGFSFYVMSFWNIFDLGIVLLLIVYYCMRIYGVFLLDPHKWNQNAYDVLAVNAILLLPRIFGMLDHHRYFSRLLISLRLLAIDLAAVLVLIFIGCSGFFVFFAFSKNAGDPTALAYKMFQILVGFTSSAWEMWPSYGWMGKTLLGLFVFITHFVVLTILITVLVNSFMSITSRASQEYHFTFAINTISMAKSDALFSYVAPSNIFAWALMPLRYFMSMSQYVWLNRAVIKLTHWPILVCIYLYERLFLAPRVYEATDLVDKPRRGRRHGLPDPASRSAFLSPSIRVREESVLGYHKDRALEEVFRRAPETRTQRRSERRKTQTAIRTWMDQHDREYHSPQNYSTIDSRIGSDWQKRLSMNLERPSRVPRHYSDIRSTASDPADLISEAPYLMAAQMYNDGIARKDYAFEAKDNTDGDGDGDDELVTNDEDEGDDATNTMDDGGIPGEEAIEEDYFTTPVGTRFSNTELSADSPRPATSRRIPLHTRTLSTNTILYAPEEDTRPYSSSSASAWPASRPFSRPLSTRQQTPVATPIARDTGRRSPRRSLYLASRPRSMIQPSDLAPTRAALTLDIPPTTNPKPPIRRRSLADLDDNDNDNDNDALSARSNNTTTTSADNALNKLMLAKMKSLEESLGDMAREMRTLRKSGPNTANNSDDGVGGGGGGRSWGRYHHHQHQHPHPHPHLHPHHSHHHHHQSLQYQQYPHHQRIFPGSDPSSTVSGLGVPGGSGPGSGPGPGPGPSQSQTQPLIEVAVAPSRERERERERAGRRLRASTTTTTPTTASTTVTTPAMTTATAATTTAATPRRAGPSRRGGVWRSPRGEGPAGLGIRGSASARDEGAIGGGGGGGGGRGGKGKERERERERQRVGGGEVGESPGGAVGGITAATVGMSSDAAGGGGGGGVVEGRGAAASL